MNEIVNISEKIIVCIDSRNEKGIREINGKKYQNLSAETKRKDMAKIEGGSLRISVDA